MRPTRPANGPRVRGQHARAATRDCPDPELGNTVRVRLHVRKDFLVGREAGPRLRLASAVAPQQGESLRSGALRSWPQKAGDAQGEHHRDNAREPPAIARPPREATGDAPELLAQRTAIRGSKTRSFFQAPRGQARPPPRRLPPPPG